MGLNFFSSSSSVETVTTPTQKPTPTKAPNPDPAVWHIVSHVTVGHGLIVEVLYPDCTTYEGRKLMVYANVTIDQLRQQRYIDPHFSQNTRFYSPVARFEPTARGRHLATLCAIALGEDD